MRWILLLFVVGCHSAPALDTTPLPPLNVGGSSHGMKVQGISADSLLSIAQRRGCAKVTHKRAADIRGALFMETTEHQVLALCGHVAIGMTPRALIASWGKPSDINRSTGTWGVSEQWVYRGWGADAAYVYFENGKVTSWQD